MLFFVLYYGLQGSDDHIQVHMIVPLSSSPATHGLYPVGHDGAPPPMIVFKSLLDNFFRFFIINILKFDTANIKLFNYIIRLYFKINGFTDILKITIFVENELYEDKTDNLPSGISQFL